MERYKILKQGVFERGSAFEARLNELALQGWKAVSISTEGKSVVLLERS